MLSGNSKKALSQLSGFSLPLAIIGLDIYAYSDVVFFIRIK